MSLFPAYAPAKDGDETPPSKTKQEDIPVYVELEMERDLIEEVDDLRCPDETAISEDEAELLETSSENTHSEEEAPSASRKRKIDWKVEDEPVAKKKKKKSKHKKRSREKKLREEKELKEENSVFYVDKKPDPGNLHVSTLYYPARPEYYQSRRGICFSDHKKCNKNKWKRYFEVDIRFLNEKNYNTEAQDEPKSNNMGEFEKITDSKKRWDHSRTEKDLTEKTAEYNKYLADNPHDVGKWLEFVNFQENRYSYDVLNYRATSESTARDACRQKQLSVLEVALTHNSRSRELLDAKLRLARLTKPSPEYLSMLKDLIASEPDTATVTRLWCELAEGVTFSAALCSAATVRDTHTAAATALRRDQRAYIELFYRYGLFLRHAGLLEQLHLLMDLVTTMNFMPRCEAFKYDGEEKVVAREIMLAKEEDELMSSGLPLSAVWARVERARCAAHWRLEPVRGGERGADPQRWPDAADVADLISPVTRPPQLLTLAVHVLRLGRVPLLVGDACTGALLRSLHPLTGAPPSWEADTVEALIPLLLETPQPSAYHQLVTRHAALPNYFQHTGYLSFVERLFAACLEWTSGRERLAILVWWIRFHVALLAVNRENRSEAVRVRKMLQRALKQYGDSPLAFAEFGRLERAACGAERARQVALTAFRSADSASRADRLAIARCVCELGAGSAAGVAAASWALVCAALGRSLPRDMTAPPSAQLLQDAFAACELRCGDLWTQGCNDFQELEPIECMLPSDDTEWWICRYELFSRLQPGHDFVEEHKHLERIGGEVKSSRTMRMHEAATTALVSHAGKAKSMLARSALVRHPECVRLAVAAGTRPAVLTLPPPPPPSTVVALAAVLPLLLACENSPEGGAVCVGAGRRALAALRTASAVGAVGERCPLLWRLRLEAEAKLDGGNAKTALYLALDACPSAKDLYVEGACAAPSEFAELTDLLLEKQLRLHTLPEELAPV